MPRRDPWPIDKVKKWVEMGLTQWEEKGYSWWAVELIDGGVLIGWCGLNHLEKTDEIEVLYLIGEEYWGRGLATEAALASVEYAFDVVGLDRLIGIVHPENIASRRVLEKIGMAHKEKAQYFGIEVDTYYLDRSSAG
jgi:ribosomal-protein-alanine N-acetyltransferase